MHVIFVEFSMLPDFWKVFNDSYKTFYAKILSVALTFKFSLRHGGYKIWRVFISYLQNVNENRSLTYSKF